MTGTGLPTSAEVCELRADRRPDGSLFITPDSGLMGPTMSLNERQLDVSVRDGRSDVESLRRSAWQRRQCLIRRRESGACHQRRL